MKKVIHGTKKNGHGRLCTFLIAEVANPERENRRMNENIIFYPKQFLIYGIPLHRFENILLQ